MSQAGRWSLRVEAESEGVTIQGHPEVKAQTFNRGQCANCSQGFPEVWSGRPNSIIKHRGQARVLRETKGGKPGGTWNETRRAGKVQSRWEGPLKLPQKGPVSPEFTLVAGGEGR